MTPRLAGVITTVALVAAAVTSVPVWAEESAPQSPESFEYVLPPGMQRDFECWTLPSRAGDPIGNLMLLVRGRSCSTEQREVDFERLRVHLDSLRGASAARYSLYDYFLYVAGLLAQRDDPPRAADFYSRYIKRRAGDAAFEPVPDELLHGHSLRSVRSSAVILQEEIWQQWKDNRWAFHLCRVGHKCLEYHSVIANLALLQENEPVVPDLPGYGLEKLRHPTNADVVRDYRVLWTLLHRSELDHEAVAKLTASPSPWGLPQQLLDRLEGEKTFVSIPTAIVAVLTLLAWLWVTLATRRRHRLLAVGVSAEHEMHGDEPFGRIIVERWQGSWPRVGLTSLLLCGVCVVAFAWSEGTLARGSFVVDRAFLDYYSFPFAQGLLIPALFTIATLFYARGPRVIRSVVITVSGDDTDAREEARHLWRWYRERLMGSTATVLTAALALLIMLAQKWQWWHDPGTAFVDLFYQGRPSATGLYFTLITIIVVYVGLAVVWRYSCALFFVGQLFLRARMKGDAWKPRLAISHPDGCYGLGHLDKGIVSFDVLLMLLATLLVLNMVEKLRFYESIEMVFQSTLLSVVLFTVGFIVVAALPTLYPPIAMHLALRQYRFEKLVGLAEEERQLRQAERSETELNARLQTIQAARGVYEDMPLWLWNVKSAWTLIVSNTLSAMPILFSFVVQFLRL